MSEEQSGLIIAGLCIMLFAYGLKIAILLLEMKVMRWQYEQEILLLKLEQKRQKKTGNIERRTKTNERLS